MLQLSICNLQFHRSIMKKEVTRWLFGALLHIDGTYKLTDINYTLVVLERTDISSYSLQMTSHEETIDYMYFYTRLFSIRWLFNYKFTY